MQWKQKSLEVFCAISSRSRLNRFRRNKIRSSRFVLKHSMVENENNYGYDNSENENNVNNYVHMPLKKNTNRRRKSKIRLTSYFLLIFFNFSGQKNHTTHHLGTKFFVLKANRLTAIIYVEYVFLTLPAHCN